jgi:flagellar protein FliL
MAEEVAKEEVAKPSGGGKGLMIALIVLVVVLFIGVGVGGYFLYSQMNAVAANATPQDQAEKKEEPVGKEFKANINELVLNISNSKGRVQLMKLSISMTSSHETIQAVIESYRDEIVDVIISQVSARNSEELLTVGGKELLREELQADINRAITSSSTRAGKAVENPINRIYFTEFVFR